MTSTSIDQHQLSTPRSGSVVNHFFKKQVIKKLAGISQGCLILEDGNDVREFGESRHEAKLVARIVINHPGVYQEIALGGSIAAGETYMLGAWQSPNLLKVVRLMVKNLEVLTGIGGSYAWLATWLNKWLHHLNRNSLTGSRKNISAHYDLGNDFFKLFLDPTMMYSSGIFPQPESTMEEASVAKLDALCQQLELKPTDHLLEIGTGWGGMAIHAAKHYGCQVTTTTISKEQYDYACEQVKQEGLEDRITLLLNDYRELEGRYDKLVSIEMIEAVGHDYHADYFRRCSNLLKPNGLMAIQAITIADQRYDFYRRTVDFIRRYIFPGGCLPSIEVIANNVAQHSELQITNVRDITPHYAKTLNRWREAFFANIEAVKAQGFDDQFIKMWEYYLCYCEGGFMERSISTVQVTFAKPSYRFEEE